MTLSLSRSGCAWWLHLAADARSRNETPSVYFGKGPWRLRVSDVLAVPEGKPCRG
jgi:hypothetical protein